MDEYTLVIALTLFGFIAVAFLLLTPVYLFLNKEERASRHWTPEMLARQEEPASPSEKPGGNGKDHSVDVT